MTKKIDFAEWLKSTLSDKGMKPIDLSRLANIDSGVVTRLLKAEREAKPDTLIAIAHALKLPVDFVLEKAGVLPPKIELSPARRKLLHLSEDLPDSDVDIAIALLEQRKEFYKKNPQSKPAK
jgi:transcriptional regulator with XRE-family HTH domain